jgi:hypothetical protein
MMQKKMKIMVISLLFLAVLGGCNTCTKTASASQMDAVSGASRARYREGEITEYNGARLDPAIGPSDNSISGVQWVDIKNYRLGISGLVENPLQLTYEEVLALEPYEKKNNTLLRRRMERNRTLERRSNHGNDRDTLLLWWRKTNWDINGRVGSVE